jgi:DNA-binding transcriptional ArsR family regulator
MTLITIDVTPADLANMRFGYNPLMELLNSYCLLYKPERQAALRRWVEEASQAISSVDLPYLNAIGKIPHYTPDFLTATPETTITNIEEEFTRLRNVPIEVVRKNMSYAIQLAGESEMLLQFMTYPREMIECLIEDMRLYWKIALSHHWPHMISVLDGDVLYHARCLALEGTKALFSSLHPELKLNDNRLTYSGWESPVPVKQNMSLNGSGIQLVPEIFAHKFSWQIEPEWQPMLIYKARGTGLWWMQSTEVASPSLEIALGAGRARVLQVLATPSSTSEIAYQLEITAGAASQHLSRLQQAGLTVPRRSGQRVYYHLTQRGEKLLALFE